LEKKFNQNLTERKAQRRNYWKKMLMAMALAEGAQNQMGVGQYRNTQFK